jgi:hypothetical protein
MKKKWLFVPRTLIDITVVGVVASPCCNDFLPDKSLSSTGGGGW